MQCAKVTDNIKLIKYFNNLTCSNLPTIKRKKSYDVMALVHKWDL